MLSNGGTHVSLNFVHAPHGHVFVAAASHLILLILQPLHALMVFSLSYFNSGICAVSLYGCDARLFPEWMLDLAFR